MLKTEVEMESQESQSGGNRLSPDVRSRSWVFTINNPREHNFNNESQVIKGLDELGCKKYIFSLEKNSVEHYQGWVEFNSQRKWSQIVKVMGKHYWSKAKGKEWQNSKYCSKSETHVAGPWMRGVELPVELEKITLSRPWQLEVEQLIKGEVDKRKIYWYWERKGNVGKSELGMYLVDNYKALMVGGSANDIKYAVAGLVNSKGVGGVPIVVWDVPRNGLVDYVALEEVKKGCFFNNKYESGMVRYRQPHVLVFANWRPELGSLSEDRWVINEIKV